jgi:hypothetical protein
MFHALPHMRNKVKCGTNVGIRTLSAIARSLCCGVLCVCVCAL